MSLELETDLDPKHSVYLETPHGFFCYADLLEAENVYKQMCQIFRPVIMCYVKGKP